MRVTAGFVFCIFWMLSLHAFGQVEKGKASYYADKFKGRHTSNGDRYDPDSLTCAHRTHPFGTYLLVSWPARGSSVIVRVNDRGPFGKGRVVDLSKAAAQKLGMVLAGVADVEVQVVSPEPPAPLFPSQQVLEPLASRKVTIPPVVGPYPPIVNPQPARVPPTDKGWLANVTGKHAKRSKGRK